MNTESNIMSSQVNNPESDVGATAFTGFGEQKQPGEIGVNLPGMSSMVAQGPSQGEQMEEGQASMEGPQGGEFCQSTGTTKADSRIFITLVKLFNFLCWR